MNNKSITQKSFALTLIFVILAISSATLAAAQVQYQEFKTDVTFDSSGSFAKTITGDDGEIVTYQITGKPGSTGSIKTKVENGNPYPAADMPTDVALTKFITIEFDIASADFTSAILTFPYKDSDVNGLNEPYALYKFIPESNFYVKLEATVNTIEKTMTVTINNTGDPTFAIGGLTTRAQPETTSTMWVIVGVAVIVIVIVTFLLVKRYQ